MDDKERQMLREIDDKERQMLREIKIQNTKRNGEADW